MNLEAEDRNKDIIGQLRGIFMVDRRLTVRKIVNELEVSIAQYVRSKRKMKIHVMTLTGIQVCISVYVYYTDLLSRTKFYKNE